MTAVSAILMESPARATSVSPLFGQLTTKLSAPRLRPSLVARQHLLDRISSADTPATVICAPAGYGKSTLVTQWLVDAGIPTAWVSLDPYDSDPLDFFSLIVASIQSIDRDVGTLTRQLLTEVRAPSSQAIAKSILEDVYATTRPFALVLDDYQSVDNSDIHAAMSTMLHNLPPTLRVFIISRTEPPLQLARLRGQQELLELGHGDLRFTNDEALELLQRSDGLELTPGEVISINDRAEGWVAGLQLVSYVLRGHSPGRVRQFTEEFSGSVRSIENYLWEEVILRQPEATQQFLIQSSILSRFTAPLCDVVTGRTDSAAVIRQLEQDRLFLISLDDVGHWYRYHHLFADVLRDRLALETSEADLANIHRSAAAWLDEHGLFEDAARHAFAGRDWDRAVRLLERIGTELYDQDRVSTLYGWLQGLPQETLERSPKLAFMLSYALIRLGLFRQAEEPLNIAERAWTQDGNPAELSVLRIMQAFLSFTDDVPRGIELVQDAIALVPEGLPYEKALGHLVLGVGYMVRGECAQAERAFVTTRLMTGEGRQSWIQLAEMGGSSTVLIQQGKLSEAEVLLRRMIKLGDETYAIPSQQAHCRLGGLYVEWNLLADADQHFLHAENLCEQTNSMLWRCEICLGLARVAWARGDFEVAFDEVERAISFGNEAGMRSQVRYARAHQARFWLAAGRLALARLWAESCEIDPYDTSAYERFYEHLTYVRILIADDQFDLAHAMLSTIGERAKVAGRSGDLVEINLLTAIARKREGNHAEALEAIDRALTLGGPGGYVRVFVEEGETIAPLLRHISTRGANRDLAQRLLADIDGSVATSPQTETDLIDALSEREVEVLRLVSAGLANRSIGDHLFITEKTVKKHLSNILSKLGASNRTQAVDQARRMKLL
jgi:LuxR family maltose regulon positive regulatory protein